MDHRYSCARASNEDVIQVSINELLEHLRCILQPKRHAYEFENPKWYDCCRVGNICWMN